MPSDEVAAVVTRLEVRRMIEDSDLAATETAAMQLADRVLRELATPNKATYVKVELQGAPPNRRFVIVAGAAGCEVLRLPVVREQGDIWLATNPSGDFKVRLSHNNKIDAFVVAYFVEAARHLGVLNTVLTHPSSTTLRLITDDQHGTAVGSESP